MITTTTTSRNDISITERAYEPRCCTRLGLDASRQTETGTASVTLAVSLNARGTGYRVCRSETRGRGWSRGKVSHYATEAEAIEAARRIFERQLGWLAGAAPVAGRSVDAVRL